ncbi:MAG: bifunctional salicylyl-CoA 5-hydroxylase/oxidoreductase [Myxococcales bacterium]|nr:bifunctional salicylyl-CoA 5-hydroxylase/oxidoreductase [Myxococcales bacterium]
MGGGPGGLYFSVLMKKARPDCEIAIYERNRPNDTFGWGVVFSDETLSNFLEADRPTYERITEGFVHWDAIDVCYRDEVVRSGGHGFSGIARRRLLQILQERCVELGIELRFETEVEGHEQFADSDLVVAADGINSRIRSALADHFRPDIRPGAAKFIWLGTTKVFDAFKFFLRRNEHGFFTVHAYPFDAETSTFIIETDEDSWRAAGLDRMSVDEGVAYCERLFADELEGHPLRTNKSEWINFRRVRNETWHHGNVVLIGDAAHTAHFSIGSGTKLAMEDAIALVDALLEHDHVPTALQAYEDARWVEAAKLQKTAETSQQWFEEIKRYADDPMLQLTMSMMSRSKRVTHDNLKLRDPGFIAAVDRWFAEQAGCADRSPPPPPMFTPFRLRGMELDNRVVVSPMCMYSAVDGVPNDWHLVHLGSRAVGGAGLVMTEMTDVSAQGRISPGCTGLYDEAHVPAWRRITDFVHASSRAKIGVQLGHAGRKASTGLLWDGYDKPLPEGNWEIIAPSPLPLHPGLSQVPRSMTRKDMDGVVAAFVAATERALRAGFDLVEVHMAHGYLLASFISPLTNQRDDEYGGSLESRLRFPLEVLDAVRGAWPEDKPISVRISAVDWAPGGLELVEAVEVARALKEHGVDIIDVSSGQTVPHQQPVYGRMYQAPFSDRIRHEVGIPTMTVGAIQGWDHVNTLLASGRADLCAMARPHLFDPYLTVHAAAEQEHYEQSWPKQYLSAAPRPPDPNANERRR